jgi:hypothetical protein
MGTDFDPVKAMREEIAGLSDVSRVMLLREREAEKRMAEAESEYTALTKINGFMRIMLDTARAKLRALEDEAERTGPQ